MVRHWVVAWMRAASLSLPGMALAGGLTLSSPDLAPDAMLKPAQVYQGGGCRGRNLSPALSWVGEPVGTRSFAVTVFDPDAPTGHGWWHWLAFDLPANTHALASLPGGGPLPAGGVALRNDFGEVGYGGACPPEGDKPHHYQVTLWALNVPTLGLRSDTSAETALAALRAHRLASSGITVRYGR